MSIQIGIILGSTRAAEQLRQTLAEIKVADVRAQVAMLSEILEWSTALRTLREPSA